MTSPVEPIRLRFDSFCRTHSLTERFPFGAGTLLALALITLAGCGDAEQYPQTSLVPKSDLAVEIDQL